MPTDAERGRADETPDALSPEGPRRLSPQQRHLWKLAATGGFDPYVVTAELAIDGPLDAGALQAALDVCTQRHDILRTAFRVSDAGDPEQVPGAASSPVLERGDADAGWSASPGAHFDLTGGPMLQAALGGEAERHRLVLTAPALCADRVTMERLAAAIPDAYAAVVAGQPYEAETVPYGLVAEWEYDLLQEEDARVGTAFWRRVLGDAPAPPRMRFERRNPAGAFAPARTSAAFDEETAAAIDALAARAGASSAGVLGACWHLLLARVTEQPDVVVGVAFDGRTDADLQLALGPLARVLPVVVRTDAGDTVLHIIRRMLDAWNEAAAWQECFAWHDMPSADPNAPEPFLPYAFDAPGDPPAPRAAAGASFALVRRYDACDRFLLRLTCERRAVARAEALALHGGHNDAGRYPVVSSTSYSVSIDFDASRFLHEHVDCLLRAFISMVRSAAANPDGPCGALEIGGDIQERSRVAAVEADTYAPVLVHEAIGQQVARAPDRTALVIGDTHVSYAQLDARANDVARLLSGRGIGPDQVVAVAVHRSPELVAAILGILKAGAAFLPIDPDAPVERIQRVLAELSPSCLLASHTVPPLGAGVAIPRVDLDAGEAGAGHTPSPDPRAVVSPEQLAYVIFTSGSTGAPRGAAIPHGALANHMEWMLGSFAITADDVVVQRSPAAFDASVWELLAPLLAGARLVLPGADVTFDVAALFRELVEHEVTVLQVVPTLLRPMVDAADRERPGHSLRLLFCGGEALSGDLHERCTEVLGVAPINLYGPAETCIDASWWSEPAGTALPVAPLGRPIANVQAHVLDAVGRPSPAQVAGELYIGGAGVGRGYLGSPDRTAASFVPDPWSAGPGARMYRTGDRAWRGPDATLHFAGRDDDQIKIRGVRIELEEIRLALARHAGVRDCAVVPRDRAGRQELVAYVEPRGPAAAHADREWRRHLQQWLPDVMMPARFVVVEQLPRSPSGKIDRQALRADAAEERRIPPRTETEARIAAVWQEVLGVPAVGVEDNFFSLGGHSLLLTRVLGRLRDAFAIDLPLRVLFDAPTVADVAQVIDEAARGRIARGEVV